MPLPLSQHWPAMHVIVAKPRPVFVDGFHEGDFISEPHLSASAAESEPKPPVEHPSDSTSTPPATTGPIKSEWVELIESLRLDIERLKTTPQPAPASSSQHAAEPKQTAAKPARRTKKTPQPIQDEWGFFDPEQCGFAALLAKLDEITDGSEEPAARRPH